MTASQLFALLAGKAVVINDVSQELAINGMTLRIMVANYPMAFDTAITVLEGVAASASGTISLPGSLVDAFSKVGIYPANNAVVCFIPRLIFFFFSALPSRIGDWC
jgi:hypothetical protein